MNDLRQRMLDARILIVDDTPANVALLEMILGVAGYRNVRGLTDSRRVLDSYREEGFDLLLLDIRMPYMDGFEVMAQLAAAHDEGYLPILVLTAQTDRDTRLRALQSGAKDFVTKPFDQAEVLNRIGNMLEVRLLYKERERQAEILEEKVAERTRELERTRLDIVRSLGKAGEFRDNETGMHVIRMSKSCQLLARAIGMDEATAEMILHASPMHDVGKIGIPDHILLKPGKLEPEEFEIMKTHATIGAEIIIDRPSDLLQMARRIALTHHEKWDGSGYPNGLKGEEIPIEGRIAAVCDVFDALTSERPYKKAWPVEKAVALLTESAGTHFDPALVDAFLGILPDVVALRQEYDD